MLEKAALLYKHTSADLQTARVCVSEPSKFQMFQISSPDASPQIRSSLSFDKIAGFSCFLDLVARDWR